MIRNHHNIPLVIFLAILFSSCKALKESSKNGFTEGFYKSRIFHKKLKKVYVVPGDDQIKIYSEKSLNKVDTAITLKIAFPPDQKPGDFDQYLFRNSSPDIYVMTTVLKYRPSVSGFPNQLSASIFNGSFYIGYRNDFYKLKYMENPLHVYKRNITHYGFSMGLFAGLGTTPMNEFVTLSNINIEYDGFVNTEGIAAFIAVGKFTIGLSTGIEHLMDPNRKFWIYQGKPWLGLSVGLHLN
jgi:hypothetical protein